jgi:hypothetical protein
MRGYEHGDWGKMSGKRGGNMKQLEWRQGGNKVETVTERVNGMISRHD